MTLLYAIQFAVMSDYVDISTLDQLFPRLNYNLNVGIQFVAALCEKSSKL